MFEALMSSSTTLTVVVVILLGFVIAAVLFADDKKIPSGEKTSSFVFLSVVVVACLSFITYSLAPRVFGYGHVPAAVEDISTRLNGSIAYQTVWSSKEADDNYVVVVRRPGTSDLLAIRVKTKPPEVFTVLNGEFIDLGSNQKRK